MKLEHRIKIIHRITENRLNKAEILENFYEELCSCRDLEEKNDMILQRLNEISERVTKYREATSRTGPRTPYAEHKTIQHMTELMKNVTTYSNRCVGIGWPHSSPYSLAISY